MELKWISISALLTIVLSLWCELGFGDSADDAKVLSAEPSILFYIPTIFSACYVLGLIVSCLKFCLSCVKSKLLEETSEHVVVESIPEPNDPASLQDETCTNLAQPLAAVSQSMPATNYSNTLFLPPNYTEISDDKGL